MSKAENCDREPRVRGPCSSGESRVFSSSSSLAEVSYPNPPGERPGAWTPSHALCPPLQFQGVREPVLSPGPAFKAEAEAEQGRREGQGLRNKGEAR